MSEQENDREPSRGSPARPGLPDCSTRFANLPPKSDAAYVIHFNLSVSGIGTFPNRGLWRSVGAKPVSPETSTLFQRRKRTCCDSCMYVRIPTSPTFLNSRVCSRLRVKGISVRHWARVQREQQRRLRYPAGEMHNRRVQRKPITS